MKRFVCATAEVGADSMMAVKVDEIADELVVCNVAGKFHVLADKCSHGEASLAGGRLVGCEIECPLHKGRFDIPSGRATRRPAKKPVDAYECVVEDGRLYIVDDADVSDPVSPEERMPEQTAPSDSEALSDSVPPFKSLVPQQNYF